MDVKRECGPGKIIELGEATERRETEKVAALVRAELNRPRTPVPQAELDLLEQVALGDTGQSRSVRYLLFLLPGYEDPTGFRGDGLLEMRPMDRELTEAFLKVFAWWRGPTESDKPLYSALSRIEAAFPRADGNP